MRRAAVAGLRELGDPQYTNAIAALLSDLDPMLAALIRPIFNQDDREQARDRLSEDVAPLEGKLPKIALMLEDAEEDV
ncbi:MAG: hypothetical protein M3295_07905, partial [Chloroflexota bacterium]|nr:hypothetical protein [Chloroflexota bacterium]